MKHKLLLSMFALVASAQSYGENAPRLSVHEWGTFTILAGSNGIPMRWYQPANSVVELPGFVRRPSLDLASAKGGFSADYVRMETPVLYFYPEAPMAVDVNVQFKSGRITELYPAGAGELGKDPNNGLGVSTMRWKGNLLPPTDAVAASKIPSLSGQRGAHYGQARAVPAAWFFHTTQPSTGSIPSLVEPPAVSDNKAPAAEREAKPVKLEQWEKFIFYRGAGDALPPLSANVGGDSRTVKLQRANTNAAPTVAFVLNVEGKKARWARMPLLKGSGPEDKGRTTESEVQLSEQYKPLEQVTSELAEALTIAITEAGLSLDEAKSMVATWREVWLQGPGMRVLALLPGDWVDSVLPLEVKPTPNEIKRVFVGRFELFTPERESALLSVLDKQISDKPDAKQIEGFQALQLGRFGSGALQRIQDMERERTQSRFYTLESAATAVPAPAAAQPAS